MHNVIFKYRPIFWFPWQKEIKTTHPEKWEELTPLQFEGVVNFINNQRKTENDFVLLANLLLSLQVPLSSFPAEIYDMQKFLNDEKLFSCWIIKTIEIEHIFLAGPQNDFKNVTIGQFAFADTFFIRYIRDKKEELLDKLIASLYFSGGIFNPDIIEPRAESLTGLHEKTKTAILFNYMIIRRWIMKRYPFIFPEPPKDEEEKTNKEPKPHSTWREFVRSLVNGDYVNEDKILNTLMHTVLYDYNENIRKQKTKKK